MDKQQQLKTLHLFAGAGGGILADILLGHRPVCAVEIEPYCQQVLKQRQCDGVLPWFPIWDDVCTFDGKPWRGLVDVVAGGFPCQDISAAGKGAGLAGERSGLVFEMLRIIGEVRPQFVFAENSPQLRARGLDIILKELDRMGYNAAWGVLGARHVGAPHRRDRMWIVAVAHAEGARQQKNVTCGNAPQVAVSGGSGAVPNPHSIRELQSEGREHQQRGWAGDVCWWDADPADLPDTESKPLGGIGQPRQEPNPWSIESRVGRLADGVAHRMDRIRALGNGQVPAVATLAWSILSQLNTKERNDD